MAPAGRDRVPEIRRHQALSFTHKRLPPACSDETRQAPACMLAAGLQRSCGYGPARQDLARRVHCFLAAGLATSLQHACRRRRCGPRPGRVLASTCDYLAAFLLLSPGPDETGRLGPLARTAPSWHLPRDCGILAAITHAGPERWVHRSHVWGRLAAFSRRPSGQTGPGAKSSLLSYNTACCELAAFLPLQPMLGEAWPLGHAAILQQSRLLRACRIHAAPAPGATR